MAATSAPRRRPRARGRHRPLLRPPARVRGRSAGERPRGAHPPVGAVARAHRRARAGALDRHGRRERRAGSASSSATSPSTARRRRAAGRATARPTSAPGSARIVASGVLGLTAPGLEAPAPHREHEPVLAEPQLHVASRHPPRGLEQRLERDHEGVDPQLRARRPGTARGSPSARARSPAARAPAPTRSARRRARRSAAAACRAARTPAASSSRSRWDSTSGATRGSPARRSLKRFGPSTSSRTTSSAQRSPTTSSARATPQRSP